MAPYGRSLKRLYTRTTTHITVIGAGVLLALLKYVDVWTWLYWLTIMFCVFPVVWYVGLYMTGRYPGRWTKITPESTDKQEARAFLMKLMGPGAQTATDRNNTVTYSSLDETIQKLLDLMIKDFVLNWYQQLGSDQDRFQHQFKDFIWQMVEEFTRRINQLDVFEFITNNMASSLTKHLEELRKARKNCKSETPRPKFVLHPWLASEELEMEFIRQAAEVFLIHLLPKSYVQCVNARHLCREILACKIMKPCIESICDPDHINEKLIEALHKHESVTEAHKNMYPYQTTYDNYMKVIKECDEVEHLKQIRSSIVSQILQAIPNNNFKQAAKETSPRRKTRSPGGPAKNLTVHVKQLSAAKSYCERRIQSLGGPTYPSGNSDDGRQRMSEEMTLPFHVLMEDRDARNHFMTYLVRSEDDVLLKFWAAVETMKNHKMNLWQQSAREIYEAYIAASFSKIRAVLDPSTVCAMEQYLTGENGPDGFWEAMTKIYTTLEERHYSDFIASDVYYRFTADYQHSTKNGLSDATYCHNPCSRSQQLSMQHLSAHLCYAQHKLHDLRQQLEITMQAVESLQTGPTLDSKMHKIKDDLEREIQAMKTQQNQLEFHIEHTQVWIKNRGNWKAHISNAEIIQDDGKMVPYFVLVVHEIGAVMVSPHTVTSTHGWVVFRRLEDFHSLHSQFTKIQSSIQSCHLPTVHKSRAKSLDTAFLNSAKVKLQDYINDVLSDETLSHSEAVFAFLSPSPEYLRPVSLSHTTRNKQDFFSHMNGFSGRNHFENDSEIQFSNITDSKADALYRLACEVFELRNLMCRLTETLRMFVHIAFDGTINCHLHGTVKWVYSEEMLVYYLESLIQLHWPDGIPAPASVQRTPQQQHATRLQAKQALLNNIPGSLKNLMGDAACKQGATKLFEAFQDGRLNKHLFYSLLQDFMLEIFPELKAFQKPAETPEPDDESCQAQ